MRKPCLHPGCPNQAKPGDPRCVDHAQEDDVGIARAGRNVYCTKRWRVLRRRKLHLDPLCAVCEGIAEDVHHKIGIQDRGEVWSLENLESLCPMPQPSHQGGAAQDRPFEG
jgi:hypothetical protein